MREDGSYGILSPLRLPVPPSRLGKARSVAKSQRQNQVAASVSHMRSIAANRRLGRLRVVLDRSESRRIVPKNTCASDLAETVLEPIFSPQMSPSLNECRPDYVIRGSGWPHELSGQVQLNEQVPA